MQAKVINEEAGRRTFVVVLDTDLTRASLCGPRIIRDRGSHNFNRSMSDAIIDKTLKSLPRHLAVGCDHLHVE